MPADIALPDLTLSMYACRYSFIRAHITHVCLQMKHDQSTCYPCMLYCQEQVCAEDMRVQGGTLGITQLLFFHIFYSIKSCEQIQLALYFDFKA